MERKELEHLIRSASAIFGEVEWVVVGSQSILGQYPDADPVFKVSMEADIYARFQPTSSDMIDGILGEDSFFHDEFGYYAQGVGPETSVLPLGWEGRLTLIQNENTNQAKAYCIDVHDMAASKCYANREKDRDFIRELFKHEMIDFKIMQKRIDMMPASSEARDTMKVRLKRLREESVKCKPNNSSPKP